MKAITVGAIAVITLFAVLCVLSEDSDAATFGDDGVGAKTITFDANGGEGGYSQKVLNGNRFYFPTEYDSNQQSDGEYNGHEISRRYYVLAGWSEDNNAAEPEFYPGRACTADVDKTYYAVWKSYCYGNDGEYRHPRYIVGIDESLDYSSETTNGTDPRGKDSVFWTILSVLETGGASSEYLHINLDGPAGYHYESNALSSIVSGSGLTLGYFKIRFTTGSGIATVEGSPDTTGLYVLKFTNTLHGDEGYLFVSVVDPEHDPSNIYHADYYRYGYDYDGCGPYGTAVRLPDGSPRIERMNGWTIRVDGSNATFPLGGCYTLVSGNTTLAPSQITYSQIQGYVGIIAFNAMGGIYNSALASKIDPEGYAPLMGSNGVTKEGFTLIGWNPSGSASDTIYPCGYLYSAQGEYTELRAVWAENPQMVRLTFSHPALSPSSSYDAAKGRNYAAPVNGFMTAGYELAGWSETKNAVGEGTADVLKGSPVNAGSSKTYYAVYTPVSHTLTVNYSPNGAQGNAVTKTYTNTLGYAILEDCMFQRDGYSFAGWSENPRDDTATLFPGSRYIFDSDTEINLYAIWSVTPVSMDEVFRIEFRAEFADYNPMRVLSFTTSENSHTFTIPSDRPSRAGYDFLGWTTSDSVSAAAMPMYGPGKNVTLTAPDRTLILYAVWSQNGGGDGDGESFTVTFKKGTLTVYEINAAAGEKISPITVNADEGMVFTGWFTESGRKWIFTEDTVAGPLTLKAKFIQFFHLETGTDYVRVILDVPCENLSITYPGGIVETSASVHSVPENSGGIVKVSGTVENLGDVTSVCRYTTAEPESPVPEPNDDKDDKILYYLAGAAILGILAIIGRRFL